MCFLWSLNGRYPPSNKPSTKSDSPALLPHRVTELQKGSTPTHQDSALCKQGEASRLYRSNGRLCALLPFCQLEDED